MAEKYAHLAKGPETLRGGPVDRLTLLKIGYCYRVIACGHSTGPRSETGAMNANAIPSSTETKFYIKSLDFNRATEEERMRMGGIVDARIFYGPLSVEKVEPLGDETKVSYILRFKFESTLMNLAADFAGYVIFPGTHTEKDLETVAFKQELARGVNPYMQEVIAYITGRAGISPLIIPLEGRVSLHEAEPEAQEAGGAQ